MSPLSSFRTLILPQSQQFNAHNHKYVFISIWLGYHFIGHIGFVVFQNVGCVALNPQLAPDPDTIRILGRRWAVEWLVQLAQISVCGLLSYILDVTLLRKCSKIELIFYSIMLRFCSWCSCFCCCWWCCRVAGWVVVRVQCMYIFIYHSISVCSVVCWPSRSYRICGSVEWTDRSVFVQSNRRETSVLSVLRLMCVCVACSPVSVSRCDALQLWALCGVSACARPGTALFSTITQNRWGVGEGGRCIIQPALHHHGNHQIERNMVTIYCI